MLLAVMQRGSEEPNLCLPYTGADYNQLSGRGGVRGGLHPPPWHKLPITPNTHKDLLFTQNQQVSTLQSLSYKAKKAQNRKLSDVQGAC